MILNNIQADLYIGTNAGEELYNSITNAKTSVTILSPYVSKTYIDLLVSLQNRNVNVDLTMNSDFSSNDNVYESFVSMVEQKRITDFKSKKLRAFGVSLSSILSVISFIWAILNFINGKPYFLTLITIFVISILSLTLFSKKRIYNYKYNWLLYPRIILSKYNGDNPNTLVYHHAKIFIIDDNICYIGSVNFTVAGMRKNYESLFVIRDIDKIIKIKEEISNLFLRESIHIVDNDLYIHNLYDEPKN